MSDPQNQPATVDDFFRALLGSNPFKRNRVSEPNSTDADVEAIHEKPFSLLRQRIEEVRSGQPSTGVVLLGAAGIGKSHLLARLYRWADQEKKATPVFLHNILASPENMPRYLVHATVSALAATRSDGQSGLYALLYALITASGERSKGGVKTWFDGEKRKAAFEKLGPAIDPSRQLFPVLASFVLATSPDRADDSAERDRARAVLDWLGGEDIDEDLAKQIGVPAQRTAWEDDAMGEAVLAMLCRLSQRAGRPFVLCVDQVDNLDEPKIGALSAFLHALIDHVPNLVVITSGVKQSLLHLRREGAISEAAWDRLAENKVELYRLQKAQAMEIVKARLHGSLQSFGDVAEVSRQVAKNKLFPIGRAWFDKQSAGAEEVRARDVITWARDAWDQEQERLLSMGGKAWLKGWPYKDPTDPVPPPIKLDIAAIDLLIQAKIQEHIALRKLEEGGLPPDADNLAELALKLLTPCLGRPDATLLAIERTPKRPRDAYDVVARERGPDGKEVRNGLCFITASSKNSTTSALKRLSQDPRPPAHRILVTDEERQPLSLGPAGLRHYEELRKLARPGFLHVKLDFEAYAALDAMSAVLDAASVGDLEIEHQRGSTTPLKKEDVLDSYHRTRRLIEHPLLRELLTEEPIEPPPAVSPPLVDPQRAREIILGQLGWRLACYAREIAMKYRETERLDPSKDEEIRKEIIRIADELHAERKVLVTPWDDDRYLQLLTLKTAS